jgi:hypothetical protein
MHLSRLHQAIFFAERTLRPGDGERWVEWKRTAHLLETKLLRQPVPIDRP